MFKKVIFVLPLALGLATVGFPQRIAETKGGYYPSEQELAQRKRLAEILKHPTFITLRLLSTPRDVLREKSTDTPAPYKLKDWIAFRLLISQSLFDDISVARFRVPYSEVRPVLRREGEVIPYSKQAEAGVEKYELLVGSASFLKLEPGNEYDLQEISLDDWYEPLLPGRYELTVRRRCDWQGDWLTSSPIYFEVIPHKPRSPIPAGVTIELAPEGVPARTDGKPYQLGSEVIVTLLVRNKSDQPLKINVIDREYGNRPLLSKNGTLVPYLEGANTLVKSKEENPRLVQIVNDFFLEPQIGTWPDGIELKKWYGPLSPGSYRLIIRHRFEIDGPWSDESAPLLFEIPAIRKN